MGKQLSGVPKHQASLFLAYNVGEFDFGNIRIGGGARYLGSWYAYNDTYTKHTNCLMPWYMTPLLLTIPKSLAKSLFPT